MLHRRRPTPGAGIGAALDWTRRNWPQLGELRQLPDRHRSVRGRQRRPHSHPNTGSRHGRDPAGHRAAQRCRHYQGHIDSRVTDTTNGTSDAPGANDDGSGTAAVIEAARVLSKHRFPGTMVYAALSGEEQGLYGGKVLADYAKAQGWNVVTVLNNDIIGNTCSSDGMCNSTTRTLSEGPRSQGQLEFMAATHSLGGENDPHRAECSLSRQSCRPATDWARIRQIWRTDRFQRRGSYSLS